LDLALPRLARSWFRGPLVLPLLLLVPLFVLTGLRVSGTSAGFYQPVQYGSQRDPALLLGRVRGIRSDEWLVNTQLTVAQAQAGLPAVNPNIADGEDMSIVVDVPNLDWSLAFRPHNWSFLVLPLEYAFAFKWWVMLYALVVAAYCFTLAFLPGHRLLASVAAIPLAFSPFVFWWYQSTTVLTLAYALVIATLLKAILAQVSTRRRAILAAALTYFLVAFAVLLYPPFQVGAALAVTALGVGLLLERKQAGQPQLARNLAAVAASVVACAVVCVLFVVSHGAALRALGATVYPGSRVVASGGQNLHLFLANHLLAGLQFGSRYPAYPENQSEASNFVLLSPYLLLPSLWAVFASWRKRRRVDWPLLAVNATVMLFLAHMFVRWGDPLYRLLLLDKVPHNRLLIAVGLAGFLQVVLLCRNHMEAAVDYRRSWRVAAALASLGLLLYAGWELRRRLPGFLPRYSEAVILAVVLAGAVYLVLTRRRQAYGLALWSGVSLYSSLLIFPLYVGLGSLHHSPVLAAIDSNSPASSRWIADGSVVVEHFPLLANRHSYSGVQPYPHLALWREIAPEPGAAAFYNRYAHVQWTHRPGPRLENPGPDQVLVHYTPCDAFIRTHVDFILSLEAIDSPCSSLLKEVDLPAQRYLIYRVLH
jgi:hypothetical protein